MVSSVQAEPARRRRRRRQDSEQEILEAAARLLRERRFRELTVDDLMAATFGRVGASDADRTAALETLFTIWMRTLYSPDPEPSAG